MCISTAFEGEEGGTVLAEHIAKVIQQDNTVILIDIMGGETVVDGELKSADLARGVLIIQKT